MNVEYKVGGLEYVSLVNSETKEDVVQKLVSSGFLLVERRREKRLVKFVFDYVKVQEKVKIVRVSVWWECLFGIYQFILVVSDLGIIGIVVQVSILNFIDIVVLLCVRMNNSFIGFYC